MSRHFYTSVRGHVVKISLLPGSKLDSCLLHNGSVGDNGGNAIEAERMESFAHVKPTLLAESFQFSTESGKFEPRGEKVTLELGNGSDMRLHAIARITDSRTGLNSPCIVIEQRVRQKRDMLVSAAGDRTVISERYKLSVVLLSVSKKKFVLCCHFHLAYSLKSTKLFLQDGPTVCWEHQGSVYFTQSFGPLNHTELDVVKLDGGCWKPTNSLKWFGFINGDAVAMGTKRSPTHEYSHGEMVFDLGYRWTVVKLNNSCSGVSSTPTAHELLEIPHEYSNIAHCVQVFQSSTTQSGKVLVLVATGQSQLVEICGGFVRRACSLTFSDASGIVIALVAGEELIVVNSTSGGVCAVWKKTFEVAREWTGFHTILVDDFLLSGSEQLLLLGEGTDALQKSFHLTDLGMCNWSSKAGMAALRSLESQCHLKAQLIKQSQHALYKMAEPMPPLPSPSTSLSCLCDLSGEDIAEGEGKRNGKMDDDSTPKCLSAWHRILDNQWIIGIELLNKSDRPICNVCISLIPASATQASLNSSTSTCSFKSVVSVAGTTSLPGVGIGTMTEYGEPLEKRIKLGQNMKTAFLEPGQKTTVVGVMGIPEFVSKPVAACTVMLHWRELCTGNRSNVIITADETEAGLSFDKDQFVDRRRLCGGACLHASDVATGKILLNPLDMLDPTKSEGEYLRDMQALDVLQLATPLLLISKHSNLQCVEGALKSSLGFQSLPRQGGMIASSGSLCMTRLKNVSLEGPKKMKLTVWSRNQTDLLLFCQHLYQQIPDDIIIKPLPPTNQIWSAMETSLTAIDKELQCTSRSLQQLLVTASSSMLQGHNSQAVIGDSSSAGPSGGDKLKQVRGDFESERRKWCNSDLHLEACASDRACMLRQELLNLQIETDADANRLARLFSVSS
ncbi:Fanconi anemia group B protein-like isoform X2 [Acanthaster planci]|uniref:Fanconi anemia group B protein-like isoform X2 n=1 Tax=Acanthaster planci TaxID=133434 RepID=A0A8B8A2M5_ACAPL|nr:Fanconi anemia group B protein-like isoform X2 [Acanthaster planci]